MAEIDLTDREKEILAEVLRAEISDLRMEISGTDRLAVRDQLRERKEVLKKVLSSLSQDEPTEEL